MSLAYFLLSIHITGKSKREIIEAGKILKELHVDEKFSFSVQERVMKITAIAGLIQLSCEMMRSMLHKNYLPSSMSYIAVLNGLRKVRKLKLFNDTMIKLSYTCKKTNNSIDTVALNSYLGAICDIASSTRDKKESIEMLFNAIELLQPGVASERFSVRNGPDVISHNIVLTAALSSGVQNSTLVQEIMDLMDKNDIVKDIYTYNLKLKAYDDGVANTAAKISLIDEVLAHPILRPDKFTIEQALLPLAREGRIGDILEILWNYNNSQNESTSALSNAYSTFFIALIKVCFDCGFI